MSGRHFATGGPKRSPKIAARRPSGHILSPKLGGLGGPHPGLSGGAKSGAGRHSMRESDAGGGEKKKSGTPNSQILLLQTFFPNFLMTLIFSNSAPPLYTCSPQEASYPHATPRSRILCVRGAAEERGVEMLGRVPLLQGGRMRPRGPASAQVPRGTPSAPQESPLLRTSRTPSPPRTCFPRS